VDTVHQPCNKPLLRRSSLVEIGTSIKILVWNVVPEGSGKASKMLLALIGLAAGIAQ